MNRPYNSGIRFEDHNGNVNNANYGNRYAYEKAYPSTAPQYPPPRRRWDRGGSAHTGYGGNWHNNPNYDNRRHPSDRVWQREPRPPRREQHNADIALVSEKVQIERKQFFFDLKENASGRFLKITEDVAGHRDTIIVPASGLETFRDALERAIAAERDMRQPST